MHVQIMENSLPIDLITRQNLAKERMSNSNSFTKISLTTRWTQHENSFPITYVLHPACGSLATLVC